MPKMNSVPERWEQYSPVGSQILGTRLIAFKTPLKDSICAKLELKNRFSVEMLVKKIPDLGLIIDLTNTNRYYNSDEALKLGVAYAKVSCPGQRIPPDHVVLKFFSAVDTFLDKHPNDGKLIGVHCTHGVNRTGYLLSRYLIQRMGFKVKEAMDCVTSARGHPIERGPYIEDLHDHVVPIAKNTRSVDIAEPGSKPSHGRGGGGGGQSDSSRQHSNNNWRNSSSRPNKMAENPGRRRDMSPDEGRSVKKSRFDGGGKSQPMPEPWSVKPPILQEAALKQQDPWRHGDAGGGGRGGRGESSRFQSRSSEIPPPPTTTSTSFGQKGRYVGGNLKDSSPAVPPAPSISRDVYVPRPSDFEKSRQSGSKDHRFEETRSRRRSISPPPMLSKRDSHFEENRRGRERGRELERDRAVPPSEPRREHPGEHRRDGGFRERDERFVQPENRRSSPVREDKGWPNERRRRDPSPVFENEKMRYERDLEPQRRRYEERQEIIDPPPPVWEDNRVRGRSPPLRRSVSPRSRNNTTSDRGRRNRSPQPTRARRPPSPNVVRASPDRFKNEHANRALMERRRSPSPPPPPIRTRSPPPSHHRGRASPPGAVLRNRTPPPRGGRPVQAPYRDSRDRSPYPRDTVELRQHRRQSPPPPAFDSPPLRTRSPLPRRSRSPGFGYSRDGGRFSPSRGRSPAKFRGPPPSQPALAHRRRSPRSPGHFRGPPVNTRRSRSPVHFRESPVHMPRSHSPRSPVHFRGHLSPERAYRSRSISPRREFRERTPEIVDRSDRYPSRSPRRNLIKPSVSDRSAPPHRRSIGRSRSPLAMPHGHRGRSPPLALPPHRDYSPPRSRSPRLVSRDLTPPDQHDILRRVHSPRDFVELGEGRSPPHHIRRHFRSISPQFHHPEPVESRIVMASSPPPLSPRRNQAHRFQRSPSPLPVHSRRTISLSPPPPAHHHLHHRSRSPSPFQQPPPTSTFHHDRPLSLSPPQLPPHHDQHHRHGGGIPLDVPDCRILINQKRLGSSLTDPEESVVLRDDSLNDQVPVANVVRRPPPHHYNNNRRDRKPVFDRLDKKRGEVFERLDPGARRGRFRRYNNRR